MSHKYAKMTDRELNQEAARRILKAEELAAKWLVWEEDGQKRAIHISAFRPATDRNQSGELLAKMVKRGIQFKRLMYREISYCEFYWPKSWPGNSPWGRVPGSDARSETVAALVALDALEEATK